MVMQLLFWDKWHQPQHSKTLTQRISVCLSCAGSLEFGVLKPSHTPEIKHRSTVLPGRQMAQTQTGWKQGSDGNQDTRGEIVWSSMRAPWTAAGVNSPLWVQESGVTPFSPKPISTTDFSEQHSTASGGWSYLNQCPPHVPCGYIFFFNFLIFVQWFNHLWINLILCSLVFF